MERGDDPRPAGAGAELLRSRLTRRGVALAGAGLILDGVASPGTAAAVPAALLRDTVRAARHLALGESAVVSTTTVALVKQAARAMMLARLKTVAAAALVVATLAGLASGLAAMGIGDDGPRPAGSGRVAKDDPATRAAPDRATAGEGETIAFRGHVQAPDGKPAVGASVYTVAPRSGGDRTEPILRAKTDSDGGYRFVIPREEFGAVAEAGPWAAFTVLAVAKGLGPDWVELKQPTDEPVNLHLVNDSVPISGRILDLQGRPVVGAKVSIGAIMDEGAQGIDPYLKLLREDPFRASNHNFAKSYGDGMRLPGQPASIATDGDGRFRLTGIGRDRIVDFSVEGSTIQSATITGITRNAEAVSTPKDAFSAKTVYGATFEHLIPPGRALTGVVRDKRTGRPWPACMSEVRERTPRRQPTPQGATPSPDSPRARATGWWSGRERSRRIS